MGGTRKTHHRRPSSELEIYDAPPKKAPIRWEPYIDERTQTAHTNADAKGPPPTRTTQKSGDGGNGVVAVLREQLNAERERAAQVQVRHATRCCRAPAPLPRNQRLSAFHPPPADSVPSPHANQERLNAALASASEANTRAARAEAKLEMTLVMMAKLEAKAK